MRPTESLTAEHDVIKKAIALLEEADRRLEAGDDSIIDIYPQLIDFIKQFADACHHGKEEDLLFKILIGRGMPPEGPLKVMMADHAQGRTYVKNLAEAVDKFQQGDKSVREKIIENAEGYAILLKDHIQKEDFVLYPMADKILTDTDQHELKMGFDHVEESFGIDRRYQYEEMIDFYRYRLVR
jgi:hemerythrin-like domain-containing protein